MSIPRSLWWPPVRLLSALLFGFYSLLLSSCGSKDLVNSGKPDTLTLVSKVIIEHNVHYAFYSKYTEEYDFHYDRQGLIDSLIVSQSEPAVFNRSFVFHNDASALHPVSYIVTTSTASGPQVYHFSISYDGDKVKLVKSEEKATDNGPYADAYRYEGENVFIDYGDGDNFKVTDSLLLSGGLFTYGSFTTTQLFFSIHSTYSYSQVVNPFYDKALQKFAPIFFSKNFNLNVGGQLAETGYLLFDPVSPKMVEQSTSFQAAARAPLRNAITHSYTVGADGKPVADAAIEVLSYVDPYGPPGGSDPDTTRLNYQYEYIQMLVNR